MMKNTYARRSSRGSRTKNSDGELIQKNICTDIRLESMFWITMQQSHTSITQFCYFNDDVPHSHVNTIQIGKVFISFDISDRFITNTTHTTRYTELVSKQNRLILNAYMRWKQQRQLFNYSNTFQEKRFDILCITRIDKCVFLSMSMCINTYILWR